MSGSPGDQTGAALGAVVEARGGDFVMMPIEIQPLLDDEVSIRVVACGMCHTDLLVKSGQIPIAPPILLGHEGAGVVLQVGPSVRHVKAGDHVVLSFGSCGTCRPCTSGHHASCENFAVQNFAGQRADGSHAVRRIDGGELSDRFFSQSSFATVAVARACNVVPVRSDAPLELLGPLGCGFQTGAGAVLNTFAMPAGASFAVFGAGAVGLSAVMAAASAGAGMIIAIDRVPARLELALAVGATHVLEAGPDVGAALQALSPGGVDFALDTTGAAQVIEQAIAALRVRGTCGLVGAAARGETFTLEINDLTKGSKRLVGIIEGDSEPQEFIPLLVDLFMEGRFPIDLLIKRFAFEDIEDAVRATKDGSVVKPILVMGSHARAAAETQDNTAEGRDGRLHV